MLNKYKVVVDLNNDSNTCAFVEVFARDSDQAKRFAEEEFKNSEDITVRSLFARKVEQ